MNTENNLWNPVKITSTDDILLDAPEITRTASSWWEDAGDWIDENITQPIIVDPIEEVGDFIDEEIIQPGIDAIVDAGDWVDENITQPYIVDPLTELGEATIAEIGSIVYPTLAATMAMDNPEWTGLTPEQRDYLRNEFGDLVDQVKIHYNSALLTEITPENFLPAPLSFLLPGQELPKIKLDDTLGQTFGYDIYISEPTADLELLAHEMVHTRQFVERGSSLANFGSDYFLGSYRTLSYENNPMEVEAYELDERIAQELLNNDLDFYTGLPSNNGNNTSLTTTNTENSTTDTLTGEDIQRFWDNQTESHFFTANQSEIQDRLNNPDRYSSEGNEFDVPPAGTSGSLPVYRYRNQTSNTYFYTFQTPDDIITQYPVFASDGIAFHAFPEGEQPSGSVPIHRFYNEGTSATTQSPVHFFTATESNKQNVIDNYPSFKYEGAGWYAYPADIPSV